jgi:hypothetical protein
MGLGARPFQWVDKYRTGSRSDRVPRGQHAAAGGERYSIGLAQEVALMRTAGFEKRRGRAV